MAVLLIGRGRNGLEVGDDGVDFGGLEVVLVARHAGAAVADLLAQRVVVAVHRRARKRRRVLLARELRLRMAHAARLVVEAHAEELALIGERGQRSEQKQDGCEAHHSKGSTFTRVAWWLLPTQKVGGVVELSTKTRR